MSFDRLLDGTCMIQRKTRVSDGAGGQIETYVDHLTEVKCRRRPAGGSSTDQQTADRLGIKAAHVVYLLTGTDVKLHDRVLVDGYVLDVGLVETPSIPVYLKAFCSEDQVGA